MSTSDSQGRVPWHVRRRRPPWWPENEPWPPRGPVRARYAMRRHGRGFPRPMRGIFAICVLFMLVGFTTVMSWLFPGSAPFPRPQRLFFALIWIFIVTGLFRRVVRVFGGMQSRLQANEVQRRHLMADIAHELRNPLAVLQGRLEGMLDGVYPRDEAQISAVLQETRMLSRLVDDLRTLAHTESGTLALQKEPTDPGVLVNEAAASFSAEAAERKVTLDVHAAPDLLLIEVDPLRIREVLTNLISNAMRHTPEGGRVSVDASANVKSIVVSVSDTGSGIPAADLPKIFDRFYKGRASRGSGLGLTIARNLVDAHGGEIRADSVEGKGTTVTVMLPRPT
jgi:signal transduction histidine kinase